MGKLDSPPVAIKIYSLYSLHHFVACQHVFFNTTALSIIEAITALLSICSMNQMHSNGADWTSLISSLMVRI